MKLVFDKITSNRINDLERLADDKISIRGYNPENDIPVEFRNSNWFLPFNQIPIKYCPTDRYSYLHKYKPEIQQEPTWESFTGRILDDVYEKFIKQLHEYLNTTTLNNTNIIKDFEQFQTSFLIETESKLENIKPNIINFPDFSTIDNFMSLLDNIIQYEIQLSSAMLDYKISITKDLHLNSMPLILFPFVPKPSYTVTSFGISTNAQPDFIFDNKIMIDIKSPPWNDDYLNTLGGYALIHEKMNNENMNLGMIITPEFENRRNVPHYFNSEIILIDDRYRRTFLLRRLNLLEQMKSGIDPQIPQTNEHCTSCGYFNHCWPQS